MKLRLKSARLQSGDEVHRQTVAVEAGEQEGYFESLIHFDSE